MTSSRKRHAPEQVVRNQTRNPEGSDTMNILNLCTYLDSEGVRSSIYAINTLAVDDAMVLYREAENHWLVFCTERGLRQDLRVHAHEEDACQELARRAMEMETFARRHPPRNT